VSLLNERFKIFISLLTKTIQDKKVELNQNKIDKILKNCKDEDDSAVIN